MSVAQEVLRHLKEFNRKERFYVVGLALGNPDFKLGKEFRQNLGNELRVRIPSDAFAAMDYHLDWIYASLFLPTVTDTNSAHLNKGNKITATQQDIDFLVAFADAGAFHMVMIEAKGDFAFSIKQLEDKACRLKQIFGEDGKKWDGVVPHFALMSPYRPTKRLNHECWPDWMHPDGKVTWMKLDMHEPLKKVTRCHKDGTTSIKGKHWKVECIPVRDSEEGGAPLEGGLGGAPPN